MYYDILHEIKEKALLNQVPIIEDEGLDFLLHLIVEKDIHHLLEIGTAVGYSSIAMCLAKHDLEITTVEIREDRYHEALQNIERCNLSDRIHANLGDGKLFETSGQFDCLFLDGPKAGNHLLLQRYQDQLKIGGYVIVDDMYFHGYIDHPEEATTKNLRELIRKIRDFKNELLESEQYEATYYEIGDGIILAKKVY